MPPGVKMFPDNCSEFCVVQPSISSLTCGHITSAKFYGQRLTTAKLDPFTRIFFVSSPSLAALRYRPPHQSLTAASRNLGHAAHFPSKSPVVLSRLNSDGRCCRHCEGCAQFLTGSRTKSYCCQSAEAASARHIGGRRPRILCSVWHGRPSVYHTAFWLANDSLAALELDALQAHIPAMRALSETRQ